MTLFAARRAPLPDAGGAGSAAPPVADEAATPVADEAATPVADGAATPVADEAAVSGVLSRADAAGLAAQYGLVRADQAPGLVRYVRQLWQRRAFVIELAKARAYDKNQNNYLGQAWSALNPLLLVASYFLVFGLMLRTSKGVDNFLGFLTIGIFIFSFIAASVTSGAKSISGNQNLVRAIRFPRAALPLSMSLSEILTLMPALVVLLVVMPVSGEQLQLKWLLLPGAIAELFVFCAGVGMIAARLVVWSRDMLNLIPVSVRLARYASGVFFSIAIYAGHGLISTFLQYQPIAVYLDLVRSCLLAQYPPDPALWIAGAVWALVVLVVGLVTFWRAEERYGRD
ncbi:ABC transporter permease [Cellulomonas sp. URHD0024]|uniref:ABC transporter permease n=1 Tax=Cellulomonas sp. URHD0024 TaxID=1302620 RepID=UPI000407AEF1|nr:ABC transporter permease [Cellulomonas sp. URHD0024]